MAATPPTSPTAPVLMSPDDFANPAYIIEQPGRDIYQVTTLMEGLQIFRGDHMGKKVPSGRVPVFFADAMSAYIYTRGDSKKLSAYVVKKQPKLFVLSYKNILKMIEEETRLEGDEAAALEHFFQIDVDQKIPYIVPVGFLKKENATGEHKLYLNRRILNIVCRLGYDGWIAMPDTLIQRNMDIQYYQETGKMRFRLNPYNPEIAICNWSAILDPI
jgi:hypothetical protein